MINILVIEDDVSIREIINYNLSNKFSVLTADNAEIVVITHEVSNGNFEKSKHEIDALYEVKNIASQFSCI